MPGSASGWRHRPVGGAARIAAGGGEYRAAGSLMGVLSILSRMASAVSSSALSGGVDVVALLEQLAALPAAPFHEAYVAERIVALLQAAGLECRADRYGNLLAWHRGARDRAAPGHPAPLVFGAHMDHPGLEVVSTEPLVGRLLGARRTPLEYWTRGVPVRFYFDGQEALGRITGAQAAEGEVALALESDASVPAGAFGVFDVGSFRVEGEWLHLRAADDLAGCAAIISALARCAAQQVPADIGGLFTRAEEAGLLGATLAARDRLLPPGTLFISVEASKALPGAELGGGAVIRVGDLASAFHPRGDALLRAARQRLAAEAPSVLVQRQLMSGGTCEATAFVAAGYETGGVAVPLGNYHNAGPDFTIAAEYIHRRDLESAAALLFAAAQEQAEPLHAGETAQRLALQAERAAPRLAASAAGWRFLPPRG